MAHITQPRNSDEKQNKTSSTPSKKRNIGANTEQAISGLNQRPLTPAAVIQLQRVKGNQYVQRLMADAQIGDPLTELASEAYPLIDPNPSAPAVTASSNGIVQRAWDTYLLDYTVMDQEKTQGQIRTKMFKWNSINDWITKFNTALAKSHEKDTKVALEGLRKRLIEDQDAAAKGKLKAPKGVTNFDKPAAIIAANLFFTKWIQSVVDHIAHTQNGGDWIYDFRQKYIHDPQAAGLAPKDQILANVAKINDATDYHLRGVSEMWDRGDNALRQRMTDIMGGVSEMPRMSAMEYFLEQVSPIHVGYAKAKAMFEHWMTGIFDYNFDWAWQTWMVNNVNSGTFTQQHRIIDSYDAPTRAQYKLTPSGKTIKKADGQALVGDNIYVLNSSNEWYGGSKEGPVHHSSFMQGAPVKCAGHLYTDNSGNLTKIDINSGHYAPNGSDLKRAMSILATQMDISDVKTGGFN